MRTSCRPAGCLYAATSIKFRPSARQRLIVVQGISPIRRYAQKQASEQQRPDGVTATPADPVKSALKIVESKAKVDPINAPRSTLPPALTTPSRGDEAVYVYWFRLGRAYYSFYKEGIKAVWFNYKAAQILKKRISQELGAKDVADAVSKQGITRADFQLLARNSHDIGKLPIFTLLVLIFGEWLVFIVPFVPNRVPGTCRIPSQIRGMRLTAEERRRASFRHGITEPSQEQYPGNVSDGQEQSEDAGAKWPMAFDGQYRRQMIKNLRDDQLFHLSSTLGLHSTLWDRVQLPPPALLLRRAINKRLQYISQDDFLILANGGASRLTEDELQIACEERGLDILGKQDEALRKELKWWMKRQQEDDGKGHALFTMLFRRLAMREWVELNLKANDDT